MNTNKLFQNEQELHTEAKAILRNKDLWQPFLAKGKIIPTGSFDLGLLVYGDLDVYFETNNQHESLKAFAEAMKWAALHENVKTVRFERDLHLRETKAPKGIYLQLKYDNGIRIWQIDIWFINKALLESLLQEHAIRKAKITTQKRNLILALKHALMNNKGKTPSFSSFYVLKAVLDEGLTDLKEIKSYLIRHGIKLFNE